MPERFITQKDLGGFAGEVLKKGGHFRFQALGNSMRPFIYNGETVELSAVDPEGIRLGDVVLCWLEKDRLVLHRVVWAKATTGGRMLLIQGDARYLPDGIFSARQVVGRAYAVFRHGKWMLLDSFPMILYSKLWLLTVPVRWFIVRLAKGMNFLKNG